MEQPAWLEQAWRELGIGEFAGTADNPAIAEFFRAIGHAEVRDDEVAWCAAFAGACLERAGLRSTRSLAARSYLGWGQKLDEGRLGAIAVLNRGADPAFGHVAFLVGETNGRLLLLGGNQADRVSVAAYDKSRLLGFRWPAPDAPAAGRREQTELFEVALAHVLEMEGGYSEDPYDPGGPTNRGITLAVFAAWRGVTLDATNHGALKSELKRIAPAMVREIYLVRYWALAACAELPAPLALMHFDAAVNHGVGAALRMLQQAVETEVDGEIGPRTRAAIAARPLGQTIRRYAEIRRARYRGLRHFWRFGRGWLNRAAKTEARALALLGGTTSTEAQRQKGPASMQNDSATLPGGKWWGQSLTIWGAFVTALSTLAPALGPVIGLDISGDLVRQAGEDVVSLVQVLATLAGTVMTIAGRARARQPLERRQVNIRL
jgi:uncharacterized protein (TIGR02594 family)